jgi:hypothetical protein
MFSFKGAFSLLQKIGKCMMLPVSVLPVAGILLGVGSANFSWLPESVSLIMAKSGDAIFGNLPLLFAIGVAIGLDRERWSRGAGWHDRLRRLPGGNGCLRQTARHRCEGDHGYSID